MQILSAAVFVMGLSSISLSAQTPDAKAVVPVIVELFTSQGCSSCPPAEKLMTEFAATSPVKGVRVIPLSLHVDYWNRIGWVDPFSNPAFSDRQVMYQKTFHADNVYTPQAVVGGLRECVGSNGAELTEQIGIAGRDAKAQVSIAVAPVEDAPADRAVSLSVSTLPESARGETWDVILAITEDDLVTHVKAGENAGVEMVGTGVVRRWILAGQLGAKDEPQSVSTKVTLDPAWKLEKIHVVAFVQSQKTHAIDGANSVDLASAGGMSK